MILITAFLYNRQVFIDVKWTNNSLALIYCHYGDHESPNNITPRDKYDGLKNTILKKKKEIKEKTLRIRRK